MQVGTTSAFIEALGRAPLLAPGQQAELVRLQSRFPDPRALAKDLVQRGWLTAFQVTQVLANRGADLVLGPYVFLERLGEGGAGQVFKVRHRTMNRLVALKMVRKEQLSDPETVQRFRREIQLVSQLSHPNIVHALDAGPMGAHFVLVMEYVEGIDLERLVRQSGPLPVAQACDYVRQAALGLQHIFERGLVHRDIKPSNLLVSRVQSQESRAGGSKSGSGLWALGSGLIKILDLGLARLERPNQGQTMSGPITSDGGTVLGTLNYLAPEQALDFRSADIRADIYSLGCTLYFLLTGKPPCPEGTAAQKLLWHQMKEPPPLDKVRPEVGADVAAMVRRMMAKRPEDRYAAPAEVAGLLAGAQALRGTASDIQADMPTPSSMHVVKLPPIPPIPARRPVRRLLLRLLLWWWSWPWRRKLWVGGAMAVALFVAVLLLRPPTPLYSPNWTVAEPTSAAASGGTILTKQPDGSILASGPIPPSESYTLLVSTRLTGITGVRLEVLPDPSLPGQGPGRAYHGNFVLSQFRVAIAPLGGDVSQARPVALRSATADYSQGGWPIALTIDGVGKQGWAIASEMGKRHVAVFELAEPQGDAYGSILVFTLDQNYEDLSHKLGRFRLSLTTRPPPLELDDPATPRATPPVALTDDFAGGLANGWSPSASADGAVTPENGVVALTTAKADPSSAGIGRALTIDGDFDLSVDFTSLTTEGAWRQGIGLNFGNRELTLMDTADNGGAWYLSGPTGVISFENPNNSAARKDVVSTQKVTRRGDTFAWSVTQAGVEMVLGTKTFAGLGPVTSVGLNTWSHATPHSARLDNFRLTLGTKDASAIGDPGFEVPSAGTGVSAYRHDVKGSAWATSDQAGVSGNKTDYTSGNPNAPEGSQVALLQRNCTISQTIFLAPGRYTLDFQAAQRGNVPDQKQSLRVLIDYAEVGRFTPADKDYALQVTNPFPIKTLGAHSLVIEGVNPAGADHTALVDQVRIQVAP